MQIKGGAADTVEGGAQEHNPAVRRHDAAAARDTRHGVRRVRLALQR